MEIPSFSRFARNNPHIAVLGIAADEDAAVVEKARDELAVDYPILMADQKTLRAYGLTTFPTTVIIGPMGSIRRAYTGILFGPQLWWATRDSESKED